MYSGYCQDKLIAELFRTIRFGNVDTCIKFVNKYFPTAENWCSLQYEKSGDTVAIIAASQGHISVLALCSDSELEIPNKDGKRPLHAAAQSSHVECVQYLLSRNVSIDCLKRADWYVFTFNLLHCSLCRQTTQIHIVCQLCRGLAQNHIMFDNYFKHLLPLSVIFCLQNRQIYITGSILRSHPNSDSTPKPNPNPQTGNSLEHPCKWKILSIFITNCAKVCCQYQQQHQYHKAILKAHLAVRLCCCWQVAHNCAVYVITQTTFCLVGRGWAHSTTVIRLPLPAHNGSS